MDKIDKIMHSFIMRSVGDFLILDESGKIVFEDPRIGISEEAKKRFLEQKPDMQSEDMEWEFADDQKYFRIKTSLVQKGDSTYQCHQFTDVSDYAGLFQDITEYTKQIADLSDFQARIMSRLSEPYEVCLEDLIAFCKAEGAELYLAQEDGKVLKIAYYGDYEKESLPASDETDKLLNVAQYETVNGMDCFLSDEIRGQRCAIYLKRTKDFVDENFRNNSVYTLIRLYVENGLLRERIVYDSEHDMLTGLYNKAKYLSMKATDFGHPERIAIYNMDVNFLKRVNDTEGHEAGDRLLKQAGRSIKAVTSPNVHGFRMGGDEFMMIAVGVTEEKAKAIKEQWKAALEEVNAGEERKCVIACGLVYGEGDYDLDALLAEADGLMYQDKAAIKASYGMKPDER